MFSFPPFCYEKKENESMNQFLYRKKEFYDFRAEETRKDVHFLNHQKIISRFMSPVVQGPCFQNLLVLHEVGTGKSGVVCSIYEEFCKRLGMGNFCFIYLSNNDVTRNNFVEEFIKLTPTIQQSMKKISRKKLQTDYKKFRPTDYKIYITKYSNHDLSVLEKRVQNYLDIQTVIIIDEVHNLIKKDLENSMKLKKVDLFINSFSNRKCIFMTGTPMRHEVKELIPLLSLMTRKKIPFNLFERMNWKNDFRQILKTMNISYYRKKEDSDIVINYKKKNSKLNQEMFYPIYFTYMSPFQSQVYLKEMNKIDVKSQSTMDDRYLHRHAIVVEENNLVKELQQKSTVKEKLNVLKKYSSIFYSVILNILQNPSQKVFIYCRYIKFAGIELLEKLLIEFCKEKNRDFITLSTLNEKDENIRKNTKYFVDRFNENDKIKIIIGSDNQSEGISFLNVQQIHVINCWWNFGKMKQAVGRGNRFRSHFKLIEKEKLRILRSTLLLKYNEIQRKESFGEFIKEELIQKLKTQGNQHENRIRFLENSYEIQAEELLLMELLSNIKDDDELVSKKVQIPVNIFIHCSIPNQEESRSLRGVLQFKQLVLSSIQEEKIKNVLFELYQNSIDYYLNFCQNQITNGQDPYFKNKMDYKSPPISNSIDHSNFFELYMEEDNHYSQELLKKFLYKQFLKSRKTKQVKDIMKKFKSRYGMAVPHIAYTLLQILSKNEYFLFGNRKFYLRFQNSYLFLSFCQDSLMYCNDISRGVPSFYYEPEDIVVKNNFDLETIINELDVDKKLQTISRRLSMEKHELSKENLKKREIDTNTMNMIESLPKKLKSTLLDFSQKESFHHKKNYLQRLQKDVRFHQVNNTTGKKIIGVKVQYKQKQDTFLLFFLNEYSFTLPKEKVNMIQKQIIQTVSCLHKTILQKFVDQYSTSVKEKVYITWNIQHDIIMNTLKSYEELTIPNQENRIFSKSWSEILDMIIEIFENQLQKKSIKKFFILEIHSCSHNKIKIDGQDFYISNFYQLCLFLNIQMINYSQKIFAFTKKKHCMKWEDFLRRYYHDRRLDSTGRNINTVYFEMLYSIFTQYFTKEDYKAIKDDIDFVQHFLEIRESTSERIKKLNIESWRRTLMNILEKKQLLWTFTE
jgi:hypothetical protein